MGSQTTKYKFPYPTAGDPADGPAGFQGLAQRVEQVLSDQLAALNSSLRSYVGSTNGMASMRAYVDKRDQDLISDYKKLIDNSKDDVTAAYKKADQKLETELTKDINNVARYYNGNIVDSFPPLAAGSSRAVSSSHTIPTLSTPRVLVVTAGGLWTAGYGELIIKINGTDRRRFRSRTTNDTISGTAVFALSADTSYTFQLEAEGQSPNVGGDPVNVLTVNGQYTYIQAFTILGTSG